MFKKVEYIDFEDHPELKALAERATAVLAQEIDDWQNRVEIRWQRDYLESFGLDMFLRLELPTGTSQRTQKFSESDFANPRTLQKRCNQVWRRVLREYLNDRLSEWEIYAEQPVEA